ncbi:Acetyltransferase (GNAT) family protein [Pseudonocardia thermophila]|uniref:Acetyltransferase (GNAT) family protein n=1 Tax=Pseudonocardia thermophila TaxID=1848 RepID=A0A1M6WFJ7_PSETH|nr:Acetyltransferase (GNAT) family protein [Pseudonocardia thermophila]
MYRTGYVREVGAAVRNDIPVNLDRLVGRRVSIRQRVGEHGGRPRFSDAVGDLTASAAGLVVHTRRGPVRIDPAAVVAARAVPPAVPRRAGLAAIVALEHLCADAWPAAVDERLGEWRLRAAGGFTGRANSALALGDPGTPVPDALAAVVDFARRHGIRPRVHVPVGSPWDRAVEDAGWVLNADHAAGAEVAVLVGELAAVAEAPVPVPVELPERPDPEWFREPYPPAARAVLDPGGTPPVGFGIARADGQVVGRVRACLVGGHVHVAQLHTAEAARGRGIGTGLLAAAATWGLERGAQWMVLQVALKNSGARSLYARLGMVEHHRYRYLTPC